MKIQFAILSRVCRLRLPMSTAHHMCEANKYAAQPKDDDLTEHYEFNWCLRSPLGGRLLMQRVTQYHHDVFKTRCEEQASGNSPLQFLPAAFGVCFGKAAIIRPRAPPRDDKLQSNDGDTGDVHFFLCRDASGDASFTDKPKWHSQWHSQALLQQLLLQSLVLARI